MISRQTRGFLEWRKPIISDNWNIKTNHEEYTNLTKGFSVGLVLAKCWMIDTTCNNNNFIIISYEKKTELNCISIKIYPYIIQIIKIQSSYFTYIKGNITCVISQQSFFYSFEAYLTSLKVCKNPMKVFKKDLKRPVWKKTIIKNISHSDNKFLYTVNYIDNLNSYEILKNVVKSSRIL